jgi:ssDNA-binding Zn-finger/Zn-ribbon topoisomerase 1
MSFRIKCSCGKQFGVKDQYAGKKGKCPHCGAALVLQPPPGYSPSAPPAAPKKKDSAADKPAAGKPAVTADPPRKRPAPGEKVQVRLSNEEVEMRSSATPIHAQPGGEGKPGDPPAMAEYRHVVQRFCPVCGSRYSEGAARCPNCHAPLSEEEIAAAKAAKRKPLIPWLPGFALSTTAKIGIAVGVLLLVAAGVYAFVLHTPLRQKAILQAELTLVETALTSEDAQAYMEGGSSDMLLNLALEMPKFPYERPDTVKAIGKWERHSGGVFHTVGTGTYDLRNRELNLSFVDGPKTYTYRAVLRPMLHVAAIAGNLDTLRVLLKQPGCNVNQPDAQGNTALHAASMVKGDETGAVKLLLDYNADHTARNAVGLTPLSVALGASNKKVTRLLREAGVTDPQKRILIPD